ncbi:phosphotriesterase family protein [Tuberibacillus sp. Marseille-P3662]|uniref:phosphotriesterase family protein n=1 Tax=Tuberibacillus sp. Marseille-P3662 TaxID=1965358 RepID=UPI000A1CA853|nr:TatD family hydrolase [Tuberibacillus sp. Marseille-P3662]
MTENIQTVTGTIEPSRLGQTMIHEHVALDLSHIRQDNDPILSDDEMQNREIARLVAAGCGGIVEVTNRGMGRDVEALGSMSRKHRLPIIAATGFYKQDYYPRDVFEKNEDEIAALFISEICEGIEGTGIRAGIISEIGSSLNEMTKEETKVFRAAIRAQHETGAPLSTHCELGTMGTEQLKLFSKMGSDFSKISIGHQDLNGDREEYERLLQAGLYIQFDTIGKNSYRAEADRLEDLIFLIEKGYSKQLMLSTDITKKSYLKVAGGFGYEHLFTKFIPALKNRGVSEDIIKTMMIDNPQRFLSF